MAQRRNGDYTLSTFILILIISCEIAFWLFLAAGLSARYLFGYERLSRVLLYAVPWIDIVLLAAVIVDLRGGAVATFAHGLAAAYLGFTVAFGKSTLAWADRRFAYHFAGGPKPVKPPTHGPALLRYELKWFGRCLIAVGTTIGLAYTAILLVADPTKTEAFELWTRVPIISAVLWFIFGPLVSVLFYWRPSEGDT